MRILDHIDLDTRIKKVRLKRLALCRPGQFSIYLELAKANDALEVSIALEHEQSQEGPGYIVFDDCLPEYCIPKFAISSQLFCESTETSEEVWTSSVAMMLMEADDLVLSLTLQKDEKDMIVAKLSLGSKWETDALVPLEQISRFLKSA